MLGYACPYGIRSTLEFDGDEPAVSEQAVDRGDNWPERKAIAERKRWRRRAVFRTHTPIARAEHHRSETEVVARKRRATGESDFDRRRARQMSPVQACGKRRCIVRDNEIAGL